MNVKYVAKNVNIQMYNSMCRNGPNATECIITFTVMQTAVI